MAVSGVGAVFLLQRMAERGAAVSRSECLIDLLITHVRHFRVTIFVSEVPANVG